MKPQNHYPLTLYMDHSRESQEIRAALERMGKNFQIVYESSERATVPAIEGPLGVVRGFKNICRYLFPQDEFDRLMNDPAASSGVSWSVAPLPDRESRQAARYLHTERVK